ncbi:MAG: tRNA (guanosine(46)-N7)-methyltransferase TrmB [Clostridiales bacterium]|jgi:tRNA (guanine-N7-)-methyltransferase|nr:tRNA (guanosine(46)-N7)-methyltransferase TrmB [Clostridiales bacterium]
MRMRKKPNLPRRIEKCGAVHISDPETYRGKWLESFPGYKALHIEIGCGRGRFTAETALQNPKILLVGVERVPEALIIGMERAARENITNLRFFIGDATRLRSFFAPGEAERIYINFCDPWPNNGHKKRRLTHEGFLNIYKELLCPGGEIHFKTDNDALFKFSLGEFESNGFALSDVTRDLHENGPSGVMTDYELKFYEQGVSINRCVARI